MQYYENNKVGKFWDETECLEKETKEILAKKILSLRQICLEKLENQEWTIQEYNDFIYIVKRMKLSRFSRFYDLIILYLNLSKEDCLLEIEKLSSSSLNGAYRVLRNLLNRAVIWDYIEYNPIHKVKCPSAKPRKEKETYNKEELFTTIKLLLDYNKKYGGMFIIDCCTGLRRCELNGLHIEKTRKHDKDIELDVEFVNKDGEKYIGGLVFARHSVVFDKELKKVVERDIPKTEKGKRGIPIPPICVEAIRECIKYRFFSKLVESGQSV